MAKKAGEANPFSFFKEAPSGPASAPAAKKTSSIFDDDDYDIVPSVAKATPGPKKTAAVDSNPLSFFQFEGQPTRVTPPPPAAVPVPKPTPPPSEDIFEDDDFDDDEDPFGKSPPQEKPRPTPAVAQSASMDRSQLERELLAAREQNKKYEVQLAKAKETIQVLTAKEKKDAMELENALKLIEKNLGIQKARAEKAEKANSQLQFELNRTREQLHFAQAAAGGAAPYVPPQAADVDWTMVKERSQFAITMLSKSATEAKTGLDILLKNAAVFANVAQILKDIDRIAAWEEEQRPK